ncbi:MAG: hypothetical protein WA459_07390 [Stellaceae bacterium]
MTGGQTAALVFALLLLLPGGCFLVMGIGFAGDDDRMFREAALVMLPVAAGILVLAGFLFWVAFRRRRPDQGGSPDAPA